MAYGDYNLDPNDPYEAWKRNQQSSKLGDYSEPNLGKEAVSAGLSSLPAILGASSTLGPVGLGIGLLGTGLTAYGNYKDAQAQEKQQRFQNEQQLKHDFKNDQVSDAERQLSHQYDSGNYSDKILEELLKNYGSYGASIGR